MTIPLDRVDLEGIRRVVCTVCLDSVTVAFIAHIGIRIAASHSVVHQVSGIPIILLGHSRPTGNGGSARVGITTVRFGRR